MNAKESKGKWKVKEQKGTKRNETKRNERTKSARGGQSMLANLLGLSAPELATANEMVGLGFFVCAKSIFCLALKCANRAPEEEPLPPPQQQQR